MIIEAPGQKVSILFDEPMFCPVGTRALDGRLTARTYQGDGTAFRVLVEIYRAHGGKGTRAMLGGVFRGEPGDLLILRVLADEEPITSVRSADFSSSVGRRPLVCGLPADLADDAHHDLMIALSAAGLPSGRLLVDQAAHDPVDSSVMAFRLTGSVLATAIAAWTADEDVEKSVSDLMSGW
jgi:hypothetical protein